MWISPTWEIRRMENVDKRSDPEFQIIYRLSLSMPSLSKRLGTKARSSCSSVSAPLRPQIGCSELRLWLDLPPSMSIGCLSLLYLLSICKIGNNDWFRCFPFQQTTFFMKDIIVVCFVGDHVQISPSERSSPPPASWHEAAQEAKRTRCQDGNVDTNKDQHDLFCH